jgi:hypothetical protein
MRGALVAFIVLLGGAPMAANWPQWRGPSGHGVSADALRVVHFSGARISPVPEQVV